MTDNKPETSKIAQAEIQSIYQPPDLTSESVDSGQDELLFKVSRQLEAFADVGRKADVTAGIISKEVIPLLKQIEQNTSFNPAGYRLKHIGKAKRTAKIVQKAQDDQKKPLKTEKIAYKD
ncbi:MAG TPA: hypothetical protein ENN86_02490, partial [Desulfobacteraceae bacterium]|nr:hypothetical protein [Desulfobacteraceae bacterium]